MGDLKITSVQVDDALCDESGIGIILFVDFNNGTGISFPLNAKANEPLINNVMKGMGGQYATDGKRVYWQNGASLSIPEMMSIVQNANV